MKGYPTKKFVTGNTIVDAVYQNLLIADQSQSIFNTIVNDDYFLVTIHRQENVDNEKRFRGIIEGLKVVHEYFNVPIICPVHPRARKKIKEFGLNTESLVTTKPLTYVSFLFLESKAKLIFTDSGGVQEESCILRVPCVTLRYNTERPETIDVGANTLAGTEPMSILEKAKIMINKNRNWKNPLGDGKAGETIVKVLTDTVQIRFESSI